MNEEKNVVSNARDFKPAALNRALLNLKRKLVLSTDDEKELIDLYGARIDIRTRKFTHCDII